MSRAPGMQRLLRILQAGSIVLPLLGFALWAYGAWQDVRRNAGETIGKDVELVREYALRVVQSQVSILGQVEAALRGLSWREVEASGEVQAELDRLREPQYIAGLLVLSPDGLVRAASPLRAKGLDLSDRIYFRELRARDAPIYISERMVLQPFGTRAIVVARRRAAIGFGGILVSSVRLDTLSKFFQGIAPDPRASVTLIRADGTILLRRRDDGSSISLPAGAPAMRAFAAADSGLFEANAATDGGRRLFAFRKVGALPLYVTLGISFEQMREAWLVEIGHAGAYFAIAGLLAFAAATELRRRLGQDERDREELERTVALRTADLARTELEFRSIFEMAGRGKTIIDTASGRLIRANRAFCEMMGWPEAELAGRSMFELTHAEDRDGDAAAFAALARGAVPVYERETRYIRREGDAIWVRVNAVLLPAEPGEPVRAAAVIEDITQRRAAEERLKLLAREVDHRAKNALAVVQALVRLTRAERVADYAAAIQGRIAALARAHTLLSESRWEGAELRRLVEDEFAPFQPDPAAPRRARADGPALRLAPEKAQSIALALHELATNAAKYGALSVPAGSVAVSWQLAPDGTLTLTWSETGGPPAVPPEKGGLGLRIVELAAREQLGGTAEFDWRPTGLVCRLVIPAGAAPSPPGPPPAAGGRNAADLLLRSRG